MKTINIFLVTIIISVLSTACENDDKIKESCDEEVIISRYEYDNAPNDQLSIISVEIVDNCLKINFGSSGCDGSTWELKLIDSGDIMESLPPQRTIRLSLKNDELCLAYFTKEVIFDISALKLEGNSVILNIDNYEDQVIYEY